MIGSKVRLKFAPGDLDINPQGHGFALFNFGDVRADNIDLAVIDFIHLGHFDQLGALGFTAAHLGIQIGTAHALAFIGRSEGTGNLDRGYAHLQTPDFNGFLYHFLMGYIGHDVLIGTDAGRQDLGDIGIGQGRKTPVDTPGGSAGPIGSDLTQSIHECKDAVLVVMQHLIIIPRLDVAEGHGCPVGKPQGENSRRNIGPERHDTRIPADLNVGFKKLLGHRGVVVAGGQENIQAALLILFHNHLGNFRIRSGPHDGGKPRRGAVHKLNTAFTKHGIIGGPQPDFPGLFIDIFGMQIKIRLIQVAETLL